MHLRENIIIVKRENRRSSESKAMLASALPSRDGGRLYVKRMADFLGHSNDLITLSSQVSPYNSFTFIYCTLGRVNLRLFLEMSKGGRIVFLV